ncbi:leucine-rich repeat-containing protein 15-like [Chironomus tepperi]|uniref:leucine-rich repeat-containing protein 15-like n=1 Tax=Chironomus tepperi TaxID=113505 RepID=UPI00391FC97B
MILRNFTKVLLTFLSIAGYFPSNAFQLDNSTTVQATCIYTIGSDNIYTCGLYNANITSPSDVLEITGTHLEGYTDANVQFVNYNNPGAEYFNAELLKKFENLKFLILAANNMKEISSNAFEVCGNLEELTIIASSLPALPSQMLGNCNNLTKFVSILFNISAVPEDLFGKSSNLLEFGLKTFKVTSLPEKLLENMENLRILDLNGNELSELSPNFLINSLKLEEVDVMFNKFEDERKLTYALNGHPNIKKLLLNWNAFRNFDFRFFSQFQQLEELSVGSTYFETLVGIAWSSLPSSLISLTVPGIGEEIPENAFNRLVNLQSLQLSGLAIRNLHKDTFKALRNLEVLRIQSTNLKNLHPELFINQVNLSDLDLTNGLIDDIPAGIFTSLTSLGTKSPSHGIRITWNRLTRLNSDSFGQHPNLQYLNFHQNRINEIQRGFFSNFHPNLTAVFLLNDCIDESFTNVNLNNVTNFDDCYKNWDEITTTTSTTTEATTPGGAGNNFKRFDIFVIIFIGFIKVLINIVG